ncbi:MAG: beta-ketoacyl synthase N-terminal-like domain-containing protein, partial [Bacteroidia bacterium]
MGRIFVTGIGAITAIGNSVAENHAALKAGTCGMGRLEMLSSLYADKLPVGEIKISTEDLKKKLNAFEPGITRTSLLALHAFKECLNDSGLSLDKIQSKDTALIGA